MSNYRFVQLDVFTAEAFAGNALAVFPEAEGLTDDQMMKIAREMNLSETVFVFEPEEEQQTANSQPQSAEAGATAASGATAPSEAAKSTGPSNATLTEATEASATEAQDHAKEPEKSVKADSGGGSDKQSVLRRLRIFTPTREIPFAGHPIVGTWNALAREGVVPLPEGGNGWTRIYQELGIGVLPVDIEFKDGAPVQVVMTQGKFEIKSEIDERSEQAEIARALGLPIEALDESLPIQTISTGLGFLAVPVRALADLGRCKVNAALLTEIYQRAGATGCQAFSRETIEIGESRAHVRMFAPGDNIPEDPATGSAAGALGAYLVHHGASGAEAVDGRVRFVIEQGDFIHRASRINIDVKGTAGAIEEVRVGGTSIVVAHGEVTF